MPPSIKLLHSLRVLDDSDVDALIALQESRPSFFSVTDPMQLRVIKEFSKHAARNLLSSAMQDTGKGRVFGYFDSNEELVGAFHTVVSEHQVNWFLTKTYVKPGLGIAHEVHRDLMTFVLNFYESFGYRRFYVMYESRHVPIYKRMHRTNATLQRYFTYGELEVAAKSRPAQTEIWEKMFGRILYPTPISVRAFVLRPEITL